MILKLYSTIALIASAYFYHSDVVVSSASDYIPISAMQNQTPLQKSMENGKDVYTDFCMQCHMANGKGDGQNFPPLDGSDWLKNKRSQSIHVVKFGQTGEIIVNNKKYNSTMPAPEGLSNQEVADVMNYLLNSWSNKSSKLVTEKEVEAVKK